MATRANRYNDPALGAAFENIASIFAPPNSADMANWAKAKATREQAERIAQLFANPTDPNFDRRNIAVGNYNPTQSFYAQDQNNATAMRGQDVAARTSLTNNAADNQRSVVTSLFQPLDPGQVRPELPASVAGNFGLPVLPQVAGTPKPLSETEVAAADRQRLQQRGLLTDEMLLDTIIGKETPVQTVGPNGQPVYSTPGQAVRTGAQAYVNRGAQAKPALGLGILPDGNQVPARMGEDGAWVHAQTGQRLPDNVRITDTPKPTGTNAELGVPAPTTANVTEANRLAASLDAAEYTVRNMRDVLKANPNVAGVPGRIKGVMQSLTSSAAQVAKAYAQEAPEAALSLNEARQMLEKLAGEGGYDPNIVRLQSGVADLAYARAQINNPSGEVSRQAFERALEQFGQGLLSSQQDLETALAAFEQDTLQAGRVKVNSLRGRPSNPAMAAPVAPAAPAAPGTTQRLRFDENGNPL